MNIRSENNSVILTDVRCLSLPLTLDCGEAFRWQLEDDGSWSGAAFGKYLNIKEENGSFVLKNTTLNDFESVCASGKEFQPGQMGLPYVSQMRFIIPLILLMLFCWLITNETRASQGS